MDSSPNYDSYTLGELLDTHDHIDKEQYPERTKAIEFAIANKMNDPAVKEALKKQQEAKKYLTFWRRFWALVIDAIGAAIIVYVEDLLFGVESSDQHLIVQFLVGFQFILYTVVMHGYFGQTLGKMVMGVKVLNHDTETAINVKQALRRESVTITLNIWWFLSAVVFGDSVGTPDANYGSVSNIDIAWLTLSMGWCAIEIITMLLNDKRRAAHDYIGKTVVVRI